MSILHRSRRPWLIGGVVLLADQLSKHLLLASFPPGHSLPLIPGLLHLTYVQNTGAAFGLLKGQQVLFIGLALLVLGWIAWELLTKPSVPPLMAWGCGLILGGAVGNLIDRLRWGYVVDFIDVRIWPVFNLGDSAITIGVGLLIWQSLRRHR